MTPDPSDAGELEDPTSWNLYAYAGGDPVNRNDASGLGWQYAGSGLQEWTQAQHNTAIFGAPGIFMYFRWTGPGPGSGASYLPFASALSMGPRLPGSQAYRQLTPTSVALDVVDFTDTLEHSRNILRGFRKYFNDHWSDPCVQWLNGRGLSRGAFKGQMDGIIERGRAEEVAQVE